MIDRFSGAIFSEYFEISITGTTTFANNSAGDDGGEAGSEDEHV